MLHDLDVFRISHGVFLRVDRGSWGELADLRALLQESLAAPGATVAGVVAEVAREFLEG